MDLRHLRYFVAVAEEGSLTLAATRRLFTAQPSLSRQIRDLEAEVGVPLLLRKPRGVALTPAGAVFLDHARIALLQIEAAVVAARRAAQPDKLQFSVGFLTGYEIEWLSALMTILRDELPGIEVTIHSQNAPELIDGLLRGHLEVAFVRPTETAGLAFHLLREEPLVVLMPRDHALARRDRIAPADFTGQTIVGPTAAVAPVLRTLIDRYAARSGIDLAPTFEAGNPSMVFSLVTSTGSLAVLPLYARRLLPASVVSRPLEGIAPVIGLGLAYNTSNRSPVLAGLVAKLDDFKFRATSPTID